MLQLRCICMHGVCLEQIIHHCNSYALNWYVERGEGAVRDSESSRQRLPQLVTTSILGPIVVKVGVGDGLC